MQKPFQDTEQLQFQEVPMQLLSFELVSLDRFQFMQRKSGQQCQQAREILEITRLS